MELNKENVVNMARSESQHMRTNSGDSVYLFTHEGLLRFADKMARYAEKTIVEQSLAAAPQQGTPWQTQPQPGLITSANTAQAALNRINELEQKLFEASESVINIGRECNLYKDRSESLAKNLDALNADNTRLCNQVALIAGDRDKSNRRVVELMAERNAYGSKVQAL